MTVATLPAAPVAADPAALDLDDACSVAVLLEEAMQRYGARIAFRCRGEALTFADVDRLSRDLAAFLQAGLGLRKGERVAVMLPNVPAFPVALAAIVRAGAVQVNVNPQYTPRELAHQLVDSGAETMIVFDSALATLAEVVERTPVRRVIVVPRGGDAPAVEMRIGGAIGFHTALEKGSHLPFTPVPASGEDLLFLQYTGGTTGVSKGAALSHRNLVANVRQFKAFLPNAFRPGAEVVVTALPLYHIFALMVNLLCAFTEGAENWLVPEARDLDALTDTFGASRCTFFTGVNTLYASLARHPRFAELDFSALRLCIGGGAAVLPATSGRWKEITGVDILEGYGLSETSPVLTLNPDTRGGFSGTAGLPFAATHIKLVDEDGVECPSGEPGEICAKGPQVMRGYWNQPEATAAAFTQDGYFRTGDVGVFDARGMLKIVDRRKDMVIVSGFNVYPNEIEAVAASCPGLAECACIGVPDAKTGEAVRLYGVRAPGSSITEADVLAHCRAQLTGYKMPRQVRFMEALPKSSVGKILRRELRGLD